MNILSAIQSAALWVVYLRLSLIIVGAIALEVGVVMLMVRIMGGSKKKDKSAHADKHDAAPVYIPEIEDEPVEEEPQPEPVDEVAEKEPQTEPVDDVVAEEEPQPEPEPEVAEEEPQPEPENEPATEEPQPAPVDEVAAAEETEGNGSEQEIELTEDAILVDDGDSAESGTLIIADKRLKVRYRRGFSARLIQSDDVLKGRYSEIRNELESYGLKERMSWMYDSMWKGRKTYAKFAIRGKTLSLYIALPPEEFKDTKYIYEDAGDSKKLKDVPMRLKLKSDRAVRWAKELIKIMAERYGWEKTEGEGADYKPAYQTTEELVKEKLIRLYYTEGANFAFDARVKDPVVEEETQYAAVAEEPAAEQPQAMPADEIAATEESAVAEPEEEQFVPEFDTPERDFEIKAEISLSEADKVMTDAVAESFTEIKEVRAPAGTGDAIVNIDVLSAVFHSGEIVTLEKMKEKKLVKNSVGYVKVLGRGVITKALTVEAAEFSGQAAKMILLTGGRVVRVVDKK